MSVLKCNRKGCENIMCDRYSRIYGYICDSCFDELSNNEFFRGSIDDFMYTPKDDNSNNTGTDWKEIVNSIFTYR